MKRILFQTISGIFLAALGIYAIYMYLQGLNQVNNLVFLCISLLALGGSVYLFFRAGKVDDTVIKKPTLETATSNTSSLEGVLQRNNELSAQWEQTNEERDKLRMLEIANIPGKK